ncbi:endonuclease/exonuclease/phosphatase family protein [Planctomicrobium sp. SH527]|uniref:endonuclease/exonuclease/phosphatase family protein n=1 Tax=Planctomicrobium sp. SH527 TaxID=3448123 RepID=UPI003F5BA32F
MFRCSLIPALLAMVTFLGTGDIHAEDASPSLKVMSFNIRFGSANDGENNWDRRKEFLVETINKFQPDLLGTQETMLFQKEYLDKQLEGYGSEGIGRVDGKKEGESMAVYYRKDRFELLDVGHYWLSETPETVGSKSWDSSLQRMVTWIKLKDKKAPGNPELYFVNTHFDHRGQVARAESATLVRNRIAALGQVPVILTGDFNAGEGSQPYKNLFSETDGKKTIVDTYRAKHPIQTETEATFNGFKADVVKGSRIDWIGATSQFKVVDAVINRVSRDGRVPSDHYPLEVVLQYAK